MQQPLQAPQQPARIPSAAEHAEFILSVSDKDLCAVFCGAKVLIEDPFTHKREIKSPFECTTAEMKSKVDIGKYLGEFVTKSWSNDMIAGVSQSIRMAAQIAPELLVAAMNEVRRNHMMLPYVEASADNGPYEGKVRSRNDSQTVLVDKNGSKIYVLENNELDSLPKVGETVRVSRPEGALAFTVTPLQQTKQQGRQNAGVLTM